MKYLLFIALSLNLFALDMGLDTSTDKDTGRNKTSSKSKDLSIDKTKSNTNSTTKSKEKSLSKIKKIDYDGKVTALTFLAALERAEVAPFGSCRLLTKPRNISHFGLSCRNKYGISSNLCSYLKSEADSYSLIKKIPVAAKYEDQIKGYGNCGALYGGIIAQYLKNGVLDVKIQDKKILEQVQNVIIEINEADCNLAEKTTNIMCDGVDINVATTLRLTANAVEVFGANEYFGYKLNLSKDKSVKTSLSKAFVKSKARSKSVKLAKSMKSDKSYSHKLSQRATQNLSMGKFIKDE